MCPWKRKLICQYKLQTSNFLGSKLVGVPNCFSKFYNSVISIKTFQCYSCTPHIDVATYGPSTKEDWIQNWITSQSTTSMTSYDRSCSLKMAALAIFSSMLYNADAIFFSQDALWLHINIQEARFQTVKALHGAQMTTINPVDLSRSFRFQSLLATASGTITTGPALVARSIPILISSKHAFRREH